MPQREKWTGVSAETFSKLHFTILLHAPPKDANTGWRRQGVPEATIRPHTDHGNMMDREEPKTEAIIFKKVCAL